MRRFQDWGNIDRLSQARGPGCFAWHHEAVVFSWMRRERTPRLLLRRVAGSMGLGVLPADAARAQHPAPRATARWVEILGRLFNLEEEGLPCGVRFNTPQGKGEGRFGLIPQLLFRVKQGQVDGLQSLFHFLSVDRQRRGKLEGVAHSPEDRPVTPAG